MDKDLVRCDEEKLWEVIECFTVSQLKQLLTAANIPTTASRPHLLLRLFYAIRLGKS